MVKIRYKLLIILILCSCAHSELDNLSANSWREDMYKMGLTVESNYEYSRLCSDLYFSLYANEGINDALIKKTFTNLVWMVPEEDLTLPLFERNAEDESRIHIKKQWLHGFTKPGVYNSILVGYKNEEVVYTQRRTIKVSSKVFGDFLNFSWQDIAYGKRYPLVSSVAANDTPFYYVTKQEVENIEVLNLYYTSYASLWDAPKYTTFVQNEQMQDLHKLLTDAYYLPRYSYDQTPLELQTAYDTYFPKDASTAPRYIWYAPTVKIVLLEQNASSTSSKKYFCRVVYDH